METSRFIVLQDGEEFFTGYDRETALRIATLKAKNLGITPDFQVIERRVRVRARIVRHPAFPDENTLA